MNIYDEAIAKLGKNKTIQFMCKHQELDVEYTPKTMECFVDIINNDDNSYDEKTESYNYEEQSEKDVRFFEGETVKYGDYYCYIKIVDNEIIKALERAKKEHELLELYRKHMTTLCKNTREGVKDSMFSAEYVAYEVYQQIKALEEELK